MLGRWNRLRMTLNDDVRRISCHVSGFNSHEGWEVETSVFCETMRLLP